MSANSSASNSVPYARQAPSAARPVPVDVVDRAARHHEAVRIEIAGRQRASRPRQHAEELLVAARRTVPPFAPLPPRLELLIDLVQAPPPRECNRRVAAHGIRCYLDRLVVPLRHPSPRRRKGPENPSGCDGPIGPFFAEGSEVHPAIGTRRPSRRLRSWWPRRRRGKLRRAVRGGNRPPSNVCSIVERDLPCVKRASRAECGCEHV